MKTTYAHQIWTLFLLSGLRAGRKPEGRRNISLLGAFRKLRALYAPVCFSFRQEIKFEWSLAS
jgi:hypothetical protein